MAHDVLSLRWPATKDRPVRPDITLFWTVTKRVHFVGVWPSICHKRFYGAGLRGKRYKQPGTWSD